jgi:hypothetical protein
MGRIAKATDLPWRQSQAEFSAVGDGWRSMELFGFPLFLSKTFLLTLSSGVPRFYRSGIRDHLFAVAAQVAAYHEARGHYPETLADLPRAEQLPRDPYTVNNVGEIGKPFGYRVTTEGFMVWSVGPDGKDDGSDPLRNIVLRVPPETKSSDKPTMPEGKP